MSQDRFDVAVVGAGIAGLAIAELFARSGRSVVLIERNEKVCLEASASQHGWFHFGSLYSIFPQNQFLRTLVGGVEDLLAYYAGYPGMNIRIAERGSLTFPQSDRAWFRDEPIEYIVCARNDPDFDMSAFDGVRSYAQKAFFLLTWEMAIKQFISRHQRFKRHDWSGPVSASEWIAKAGFRNYSREVISKPDHPGVNLDVDTHFRIVGYDRPMRATSIITQLAQGLLGAGGTLMTSCEVDRIQDAGRVKRIHAADGRSFEADRVIVAAGRWLSHFLRHEKDVKVVGSPLLVAYPAVSDHNFVRMTPFVEKSVNHIHHVIDGRAYSLIGGGYFADPNSAAAVSTAKERLSEMASRVFPKLAGAQVCESYLGFKTEIVARSGERNYQYFIREIGSGVFTVVPGKFSLAFSLATNTFRQVTGEVPGTAVRLSAPDEAAPFVDLTQHARIVRDRVA